LVTHNAQFAKAQTTLSAAGTRSEVALQSDAFVDSIGVGTHLTYDDTDYYKRWPQILDALRALSIRHIRDGYYDTVTRPAFTGEHHQLAASGIKTSYVVPTEISPSAEALVKFSAMVTDLEGFEAPNECDSGTNCGGGGIRGINNMLALLPQISSAAKVLNVPVIGPSFEFAESNLYAGNISSLVDYGNLHLYFGGLNPGSQGWGDFNSQGNAYGSLAFWLDASRLSVPGMPAIITETGYMSYPVATQPFTIPESVGASYIPRTYLLAFGNGIKRTYTYELLDEFSSPGYGLLHEDFTPKPAFKAIKNLVAVLSDPGTSFSPGVLSYSISGDDANVDHLLLQKRDGSFWLVLWIEKSSFDRVSLVSKLVTPQNIAVTINGPRSAQQLLWLNEQGNMSWKNIRQVNSQVQIQVTDQVSIVKILPN
jgi:hypothetical protein